MPSLILMLRIAAWVIVVAAMWGLYDWMRRRSRACAGLCAWGLVARAVLGVALFSISLWHVPILRELQLGDGFWTLALDGRTYFEIAAHAAETTVGTIDANYPSPMFLRVLATWLWIFGATPLSAVLLNLACYACTAALVLIAATRSDRTLDSPAAALALAGFTLTPSLVLFSTQPVKDPLCVLLIVAVICGFQLWTVDVARGAHVSVALCAAILLMVVGLDAVGGIRAYVAALIIASLLAAALWSAAWPPNGLSRARIAGVNAGLIVILWMPFAHGAGPYYHDYMAYVHNAVLGRISPLLPFDVSRAGFIATGGATSFASADNRAHDSSRIHIRVPRDDELRDGGDDGEPGWAGRLVDMFRGLAVMAIPMFVLRGLSLVTFSGGRGLLAITDLDTIAIDVFAAAAVMWVWSARRRRGRHPVEAALMLAVVLAVVTGLALAYVVTNFGTLFRLRLLVTAPLWMIPTLAQRRGGRVYT